MKEIDAVAQINDRFKRSHDWVRENYWDQWEEAFRLYKCEEPPATDENDKSKIDESQTRIGMPDTWGIVRRQVARYTAQIPNLRFTSEDAELAKRVSRKAMRDWDRGEIQRTQKRHVTQAALFGWSIRAWSWDTIEYPRRKRIDPLSPTLSPEDRKAAMEQYAEPLSLIEQEHGFPASSPGAMAMLMGEHSRGNRLPIEQKFKQYEGPKADFLFIGDCYPEPNFESIQNSNWFGAKRRRNRQWIDSMAKRYPFLAPGFEKLLRTHPKGSEPEGFGGASSEPQTLRRRMLLAIDRVDTPSSSGGATDYGYWTIPECHEPGPNAKITYIGDSDVWIGEIPYPYDLNGRIAFTELVFIDDMLAGIGDSHARIIRGLNKLHNRQNNLRMDLTTNILRPYLGTTDPYFFENPDSLTKAQSGYRVIHTKQGPNSIWVMGEQGAIAAAAAGMADESSILRAIQSAAGESNLSMSANVDPSQARTATGARVMAYNMDQLTKDAVDMLNLALNDDATMVYLLNRSEMPELVRFDAAPYERVRDPRVQSPAEDYIEVSPDDFQQDGELLAEVGSTLADDDEAEVVKAQNMFALAVANPTLINPEKARDNLLVRFGYGKELAAWVPPPPPPPQPPPPEPPRLNASLQMKMVELPVPAQLAALAKFDLVPPGMDPSMMPPAEPVPPAGATPESKPKSAPAPKMEPPREQAVTALEAAQGMPVNGRPV